MPLPFRPLRSLTARIAALCLLVAFSAIVVIAVGVLVVAKSTFDRLMVEAGAPVAEAEAMFNQGVATIFVVAAMIGTGISVFLAVMLSARLIRPLKQMAVAAHRIAVGDYDARVAPGGPAELASLADSFNLMAHNLAQEQRERREFIINAAHELRTPLTNLQGYLEGLRDGVIAPTPEQFRSLHEEAQRLVRLSRSLDALAENDRLDRSVVHQVINLGRVVRSAYEVARPAFETKAIQVELALPDRLRVRAEPDHVAQVLGNLLQNAARYTPPGGQATICAEVRRSDVLVSVTNTGDGIPAEDLPHLFERFYRVEKSRDSARGGAGIGLAIVKELVEASGGEVGADSDGRSSRFWFSLPAA
ncbi:MAG: HAMP domain-containing histidine kinase [Candidatus Dormibacteraeota bacterium]|nr:HAMP domain-containing histidine kinase [Candidatus Dormibacteraeota bacterium]